MPSTTSPTTKTRSVENERLAAYAPMQVRLHKYKRDPERLPKREITPRSLEIIAAVARYKFLPSSMIVGLIDGDRSNVYRHLQALYHNEYLNRFSFPRVGNPGEFIYYLDNTKALDLLASSGLAERAALDYEGVRNNREKAYFEINLSSHIDDVQGRLMHLHHELMISRFHFMLEAGCRAAAGRVTLKRWQQGSSLWHSIEAPKVSYDTKDNWREMEETEFIPHRPDAFFTLFFPKESEGRQYANFFYEADRHKTSIKKHNRKLRGHFHYVVKHRRHVEDYGIKRVRAVLVESIHDGWADQLRRGARHGSVSGSKPSPLFWFTTSAVFTKPREVEQHGRAQAVPQFLLKPEVIFNRIWLTPTDPDEPQAEHFKSLLE